MGDGILAIFRDDGDVAATCARIRGGAGRVTRGERRAKGGGCFVQNGTMAWFGMYKTVQTGGWSAVGSASAQRRFSSPSSCPPRF